MYNYEKISANVRNIFNNIIKNNLENDGLKAYDGFYNNVIKLSEDQNHYEKCFKIINPLFNDYLDNFLKLDAEKFNSEPNNKKKIICFYFPNIINSLAHIEFFNKIFRLFNDDSYELWIASNLSIPSPISKFIQELIDKKIIKELIHVDILSLTNVKLFTYKYKNYFDKFVVWGLPLIIPLWTRLFFEKVFYVTTKFEYGSFPGLDNAISFQSKKDFKTTKIINKTCWHRLPPFFPYHQYNEHYKIYDNKLIKLISVNRPEKINDPIFLNALKKILMFNENVKFYYCGRTQNKQLNDFFISNKLISRIVFLGWIDPKDVIGDYDIFLDSPSLSGILSANYFIAGIPVVSYNTSLSYIVLNNKELQKKLNHNFIFDDIEYVKYTNRLIRDKNYLKKISSVQKKSKDIFIRNNELIIKIFIETLYEANTI